MDKNNIKIGKIGEEMVRNFLIKNKYKILFRNYRVRSDEIDIIAKSFDQTLVFVEVKTLNIKNGPKLIPEDNLTKDKLKKISRACCLFAGFRKDLINENRGWRIDLVTVVLKENGNNEISHYKNITG